MEEDEQDKAKSRFKTYPDHPVFILIILFCLYLSLGEEGNMMVQDGRRWTG